MGKEDWDVSIVMCVLADSPPSRFHSASPGPVDSSGEF